MDEKLSVVQGCMLGMAVGDAMGAGVDNKSLEDIRADYGPDGLLGYDLANSFAEISSYSQVAAYAMNGLLVAMSRGQLRMPFAPAVATGLREWARAQDFPRETALGALALYISDGSVVQFQPMNINFGLIPQLGYRVKGKRNKNAELSQRSLTIIDTMREKVMEGVEG